METKSIIVLMVRDVRLIAAYVGLILTQTAFVSITFAGMLVPLVVVMHFVFMDRYEESVGNVVRRRIYVSINRFVSNVGGVGKNVSIRKG